MIKSYFYGTVQNAKEAAAKVVKVQNGIKKYFYFDCYPDAIQFAEGLKPLVEKGRITRLDTYIRGNGKWLKELEF